MSTKLDEYLWIAIVGCIFGFVYCFAIGANDVANVSTYMLKLNHYSSLTCSNFFVYSIPALGICNVRGFQINHT